MTKEISTEYTPGIGWQYTVYINGVLAGRYGSFETEIEAMLAGIAEPWPVEEYY